MQTVAVALIDALGFKGIWKAHEPSDVLATLKGFRHVTQEMTGAVNQWPSPVAFHAQSISDSLVFAAAAADPVHAPRMLELLGVAVARFIRNALLSDLPLLFRGCITIGPGFLEDGIVLGEAIDCAATQYERADAACVWLHPDARRHIEAIEVDSRDAVWLNYGVPLKDGNEVHTFALNPYGFTYSSKEHQRLTSQVQTALARRAPGVAVNIGKKLQNTATFFAECAVASRRWWIAKGCSV